MTTTETTLVIILVVLLSIFFTLCIAVMVAVFTLIQSLKRVAAKAEDVVDSVESAAEVFTATTGKLTLMKMVSNIIKLTTDRSKK